MAENQGIELTPKRPVDGRMFVQESTRPLGTFIYFTSEGDDVTNPTKIGDGERLEIVHNIGDPTTQIKNIMFNVKENQTFIHEGYVIWKNASFDSISLSIVPQTTAYTAGTNTNFHIYGPFIIPVAGTGQLVVQPQDMRLVEMPISLDFGVRPPAFWNADYDSQTHQFSNITPAPGNGVYNMFAAEICLSRFVNKISLLDQGFMMLQTAETCEIGHGMSLRMIMNTHNSDHSWQASCILAMHRVRTC